MVVDDEKEPRELAREFLEGSGFVCFTACGGQAALEVFAANQIDLAVVDVTMPDMSGLDLFKVVKEKYPRTAVLLVGVENRMDFAVSRIKDGALDYLVKPVDKVKLLQAVNEALEKHSEYLDNLSHQQHLEELLMYQSKALENKIREAKALSGMFAELLMVKATATVPETILRPGPGLPEAS